MFVGKARKFGANYLDERTKLSVRRFDPVADFDRAHSHLHRRPHQIDMQQAVIEPGAAHFDALGEDERALELPRGDAAVQVDAVVVGLLAADDKLVVLDGQLHVAHRKPGNRKGNAQGVFADLLDIVGRIAVA
jgi:hypothetical protein